MGVERCTNWSKRQWEGDRVAVRGVEMKWNWSGRIVGRDWAQSARMDEGEWARSGRMVGEEWVESGRKVGRKWVHSGRKGDGSGWRAGVWWKESGSLVGACEEYAMVKGEWVESGGWYDWSG